MSAYTSHDNRLHAHCRPPCGGIRPPIITLLAGSRLFGRSSVPKLRAARCSRRVCCRAWTWGPMFRRSNIPLSWAVIFSFSATAWALCAASTRGMRACGAAQARGALGLLLSIKAEHIAVRALARTQYLLTGGTTAGCTCWLIQDPLSGLRAFNHHDSSTLLLFLKTVLKTCVS
jgi:hypothetical protein